MAQNIQICQVDPALKEKLKKFRFRKEKTTAAITMKIDKASMTIVTDEEFEDISIDDLQEELPTQNPSYFVYSYVQKHDDGRVSYPLCFVFVSPQGCKPELQMMYAGSKLMLVQEVGLTKVYEVRSTEELTEEWLQEKLQLR